MFIVLPTIHITYCVYMIVKFKKKLLLLLYIIKQIHLQYTKFIILTYILNFYYYYYYFHSLQIKLNNI